MKKYRSRYQICIHNVVTALMVTSYFFLTSNVLNVIYSLYSLSLNVVHKFSTILADIKNVERRSIWSGQPPAPVLSGNQPPPPPVLGSKIIFVRGLHLSERRREQRDRMVKRKQLYLRLKIVQIDFCDHC